ncbi:hypothetical protein KUTeg_021936 [Tegillarca granosa]|uniref:Uncharacterized protein n=1 Tax=Tegillarca granosa TaxID=220873 RepID=A0ABQ9EA49_TEGGR|nr:hypothetical protein KUTeg_021936 [Tegillarca granosa]
MFLTVLFLSFCCLSNLDDDVGENKYKIIIPFKIPNKPMNFLSNSNICNEVTNEIYCFIKIITFISLHCHCNEIYCFIQVYTFIMYVLNNTAIFLKSVVYFKLSSSKKNQEEKLFYKKIQNCNY